MPTAILGAGFIESVTSRETEYAELSLNGGGDLLFGSEPASPSLRKPSALPYEQVAVERDALMHVVKEKSGLEDRVLRHLNELDNYISRISDRNELLLSTLRTQPGFADYSLTRLERVRDPDWLVALRPFSATDGGGESVRSVVPEAPGGSGAELGLF